MPGAVILDYETGNRDHKQENKLDSDPGVPSSSLYIPQGLICETENHFIVSKSLLYFFLLLVTLRSNCK